MNGEGPIHYANSAPLGRLHMRVVEARNLQIRGAADNSTLCQPYCVIEFEKTEVITREAITMSANADGTFNPLWKHEAIFDVFRADSSLQISIWDRSTKHGGEETFLGMMKILPIYDDTKQYDNWFRLLPRSWSHRVKGDIRVSFRFSRTEAVSLKSTDFEFMKVLGKGAYGKVLQVRKRDTCRVYAMKIINKRDIAQKDDMYKEIVHTISERNVLIKAQSPFLVGLKFAFQSPEKLYLVLDYMNGGELFFHLQRDHIFTMERAKFYLCELVLALGHLHQYNIVYRDLKPENILLDINGHIALTDFGLCKEEIDFNTTTHTFCGTPEYLAPEVILRQGHGLAVDWWALGILFYEMTTGLPMFYSTDRATMFHNIVHQPISFSPSYDPIAAKIVQALLQRDPQKRLGAGPRDALEVQEHEFFDGIDWIKVLKKDLCPPFKPNVECETDTSNFDPEYTSVPATIDSVSDHQDTLQITESFQEQFEGFSYTNVTPGSSATSRFKYVLRGTNNE
ncbi:serine/threonine-protein kinase SCH9 [Polychytrium aggregatum]|uniref:serine/threonine-protein kinase SCH9 n=1 Tax=Polychytrium aggregatum TaxID=110093 RepID=UPI0022FE833C|nr:serine/threonine-protein kinase SCH9 [Polychytrium aggregatum]KAI9204351.1 serine/threonine-protein kinase SCH9 [Polychytrium aggregatum]